MPNSSHRAPEKWKREFPESEENKVHQEKEYMKNTLTEMNIFVDRWVSRDAAEERNSSTEMLEKLFMKLEE